MKLRRKHKHRDWYDCTGKLGWGGQAAWPVFWEEPDYRKPWPGMSLFRGA